MEAQTRAAVGCCNNEKPLDCDRCVYHLFEGAAQAQGLRPHMEDFYIFEEDLKDFLCDSNEKKDEVVSRITFCGVYDGHGGGTLLRQAYIEISERAARFLCENLHVQILLHREFTSNVETAIFEGFRLTDDKLVELQVKEDWYDGSTAVVALFLNNMLFVGNVGDSEACLVSVKLVREYFGLTVL